MLSVWTSLKFCRLVKSQSFTTKFEPGPIYDFPWLVFETLNTGYIVAESFNSDQPAQVARADIASSSLITEYGSFYVTVWFFF